jgi:predicted metal-binding membrane protein
MRSLLSKDRWLVVAALSGVIVLAWAYLFLGAGISMEQMDMGGGQVMFMPPAWSFGYALTLFIMWAIMMAAMMLPSAAPTVLLVDALRRRTANGRSMTTALFSIGYLLVWIGFSAGATLLQWRLDKAGFLSESMASVNRVVSGIFLVAAGIYQWTPLKQICLRHCRSPMAFLVAHWRTGYLGVLATGIAHGLYCLGCCWVLMGLLFVGGLMNLLWVAVLALLVLVEKTFPHGRLFGQAIGVVLLLAGVAFIGLSFA